MQFPLNYMAVEGSQDNFFALSINSIRDDILSAGGLKAFSISSAEKFLRRYSSMGNFSNVQSIILPQGRLSFTDLQYLKGT